MQARRQAETASPYRKNDRAQPVVRGATRFDQHTKPTLRAGAQSPVALPDQRFDVFYSSIDNVSHHAFSVLGLG